MTLPPMQTPRLLLLMGSGELTPTMAKVHRRVIERLGGAPLACAFLDTPFAFQENAAELAERAVTYFRERLSSPLEVVRLDAGPGDSDELAADRVVAALRGARYVFAGPGSPSYALKRWQQSAVPALLADKLANGGALGFASAAALTLGAFTVPVYEIYKVGQTPHWLAGLDVLGVLGWRAAVVPHYDNAEGGTHDTRFCYLGERRLRVLEAELPDDAFVLGVDEHTALVCDRETGSVTVSGRGQVTLRRRGASLVLENGSTHEIDEIAGRALELGATRPAKRPLPQRTAYGDNVPTTPDLVAAERELSLALEAGEARRAVAALLRLEDVAGRDGAGGLARGALRAALVGLEGPLGRGLADDAETIGAFVSLLLELRARVRAERRFELADEIRDRLGALGVEVRDAPEGSTWLLSGSAGAEAE